MWLALLAGPVAAATCQPITGVSAAPERLDPHRPPTDGWVDVTLPDTWPQRWPGADVVWYRVQWRNECANTEAVAVAIKQMTMAGTVYLNDALLWRDARLEEPFSRSWNMPRYWLLPTAALSGPDNTLWFRITGRPHDRLGLDQVNIGSPDTVLPLHKNQVWQQRHLPTLSMSISLALGCLFLTLWLVRRTERAFGWYALASLSWALFISTILVTSPWPFNNSADWSRWTCSILAVYCSAFCLFTWTFGGQQLPRLARGLGVMTTLAIIALWLSPDAWLAPMLMVITSGYSLLFLANCIQFQIHAWHNRQRRNVLLALCLLLFIVTGLHDLMLVLQWIDGDLFYTPITSPIAMIIMFFIVADSYARNLHRIERFNEELQSAVDKTRVELTSTLQHQHQLESNNIRLKERLQLSHDLHDSLGSSLMRSIATVERSSRPVNNGRVLSILKELRDDLRQVIDNSSSTITSNNTTPAEWIAPLRHRFVRLFDELGLSSRWDFPGNWPRALSSMQLLALTRFVEEALTNAIKHSGASELRIPMRATQDAGLLLEVCDNGAGFDVDTARNDCGVGMHSMHARITRVGGHLDIQSRPGETLLRVSLGG